MTDDSDGLKQSDLTHYRARMEPVYRRVAADLRAIQHPEFADIIDWERELLWGSPDAPEPVGFLRLAART